jgi:DNA-binding transcriptional ArsR family regulator
MAGKKNKNELDGLRSEVRELKEAVYALRDRVQRDSAAASVSQANGTSVDPDGTVAELRRAAEESGTSSAVSTYGYFGSDDDGNSVRWSLTDAHVATITPTAIPSAAATLAAAGHPQRLAILDMILKGPTSAASLVESLKLGTSGAAYHHLNVLQGAGFVTQMSRGTYRFREEMIPTYLTLVAALSPDLKREIG